MCEPERAMLQQGACNMPDARDQHQHNHRRPTSVRVPRQTSVKVTASVWLAVSGTWRVTLPSVGVEHLPGRGQAGRSKR
jgi:hypothetical protein